MLPFYGVYISQLIRFARVCSNINDFNNRTLFLTKLLKIVSEFDQEIPKSQTVDKPVAPGGRAAEPSQDTRKTN